MSSGRSGFAQNEAVYMQFSQTAAQGHEDYIQSVISPDHTDNVSNAHINPKFTGRSHSDSTPKMHINPNFNGQMSSKKVIVNPNFKTRTGESKEQTGSVHINPKFKQSPPGSPKHDRLESTGTNVHINPKFANRPLPSVPSTSSNSDKPVKPERTSINKMSQNSTFHAQTENIYGNIHVNPSFSSGVAIDQKKKLEFEQSIRNSVESSKPKLLVNPKFRKQAEEFEKQSNTHKVKPEKPKRNTIHVNPAFSQKTGTNTENCTPITSKIQEEKENVPSVKSKYHLFTPLRKTPFRKIGTKKLIRVKKKSVTPTSVTPKNASFKKIGTKKLIRIKQSGSKEKVSEKCSPAQLYKVKTKTKIVKSSKKTPPATSKSRFSFVTPLSIRKHKIIHRNSSSKLVSSGSKSTTASIRKKIGFKNRFKLDRRPKTNTELTKKKVDGKQQNQTQIKKISGSFYHVNATSIKKSVPPKHTRSVPSTYRHKPTAVNPTLGENKFITVQGVRFSVADNGRKLKRLAETAQTSTAPNTSPTTSNTSPSYVASNQTSPINSKPSVSTTSPSLNHSTSSSQRKVYLGGEEFSELQPGVFTRSRHSLTRQSLTQAKQRSINIILKSQNRSKQYCMFYNKFGKCTKRDKGSCPFIHDSDKIAVCRRFLKGACVNDACLFSHKVAPEKMPTCKFFLEGVCTADRCPYLHVKVNAEADICDQFLKGYCSNGTDCKQRHVMACPEFDKTGLCRKGDKCPFPHVDNTNADKTNVKKKPPAKPKRKSLGQTPDHTLQKKSRVGSRYYQDNLDKKDESNLVSKEQVSDAIEELKEVEAKRKRLLRKIELAKQGWTTVKDESTKSLDDSGPYERIDTDSSEDEVITRTPMGQLGDFISLAGYSSEEAENCTEDRLI